VIEISIERASSLQQQSHGSVCPRCGTARVHRSHRRGVIERVLASTGATIRRCHACNVRFARLAKSTIYVEDGQRVLRRIGLIALMLVGSILVLGFLSWIMKKQAAYPYPEGLRNPASVRVSV
jgi:hypothetical protein